MTDLSFTMAATDPRRFICSDSCVFWRANTREKPGLERGIGFVLLSTEAAVFAFRKKKNNKGRGGKTTCGKKVLSFRSREVSVHS